MGSNRHPSSISTIKTLGEVYANKKKDFVTLCRIIYYRDLIKGEATMSNEEKLTTKEKFDLTVEAGLQLIPVVGGPLSTAYFGTKNEKRFKRIESFYEEFSSYIRDPEQLFNAFTEHDEDALIAIIERLNEKIESEVLEEKRSFFKSFLKQSLTSPTTKVNFDERRFFIDTLAQMTLLECELTTYLAQNNGQVLVGSIEKPGIDQSVILGTVGRLKNYGFISAFQQSMTIGGNADNALNEGIGLNNFGKRFFDFCLQP